MIVQSARVKGRGTAREAAGAFEVQLGGGLAHHDQYVLRRRESEHSAREEFRRIRRRSAAQRLRKCLRARGGSFIPVPHILDAAVVTGRTWRVRFSIRAYG